MGVGLVGDVMRVIELRNSEKGGWGFVPLLKMSDGLARVRGRVRALSLSVYWRRIHEEVALL